MPSHTQCTTSLPERRADVNTPGFAIIQRIKQAASDHSVTDAEFRVLTLLMLAAGPVGETTWKHRTIADRIGKSDRSVRRALDKLKDTPYLAVEHRGYQRANKYVMPWHSHREGSNGSRGTTKAGGVDEDAACELFAAIEAPADARGDHRGDGTVAESAPAIRRGEQLAGRGNDRPPSSVPDRTEIAAVKHASPTTEKSKAHTIIEAECAALAGRKLTPADDAAVAEFVAEHGAPTRAQVRAGIAATLVRAQGKRINGVRYFFAEMLRARVLEDAAGYAEHCVNRWMRERERR